MSAGVGTRDEKSHVKAYQDSIYPTSGQSIDAPASPKKRTQCQEIGRQGNHASRTSKNLKLKGHKMLIDREKVQQYLMIT